MAIYRINKIALENNANNVRGSAVLPRSPSTFTYSAMFPTCPVAVQWRGTPRLFRLDERWIASSALCLNDRLQSDDAALFAVTRLDVSYTALESLPRFVFELCSLRILHATHCQLSHLSELPFLRDRRLLSADSGQRVSVLQELNLSHNLLCTLPDDLFRLPNLRLLDVSNNALTLLSHATWFAPTLRELNLAHNHIAGIAGRRPALLSGSASWQQERQSATIRVSPVGTPSVRPGSVTPGSLSNAFRSDSGLSGGKDDASVSSALSERSLHHRNLWMGAVNVVELVNEPRRAEIATPGSGGRTKTETSTWTTSALQVLNLAHNSLYSISPELACLAPALTKLNVSHNRLDDAGFICDYPASLKHLDLSCNALASMPRAVDADANVGIECLRLSSSLISVPARVSPHPTAYSTSAVLLSTSAPNASASSLLSIAGGGGGSPTCAHRRHGRLDHLRTINVSSNVIARLLIAREMIDAPDGADSVNRRSRISSDGFTTVSAQPNQAY